MSSHLQVQAHPLLTTVSDDDCPEHPVRVCGGGVGIPVPGRWWCHYTGYSPLPDQAGGDYGLCVGGAEDMHTVEAAEEYYQQCVQC